MERKALKVKELAERLGICRSMAYKLSMRNEFYPAFRIGKRICIDSEKLEKWINEQGRMKDACNDN